MLSDEIGKKLESIIDRVPGGVNVRPLIESSVQIACLMTFRAEKARRNRWERVAALRGCCRTYSRLRAATAVN